MGAYLNFDISVFGYEPHGPDETESFKILVLKTAEFDGQDISDACLVHLPTDVHEYQRLLANRSLSKDDLLKFGKLLGDMLLPESGNVNGRSPRWLFDQRLRTAEERKQKLRIQIYIEDNLLASLPWEYLWMWDGVTPKSQAGREGFLARQANISIVRRPQMEGGAVPSFPPLAAGEKVRMLVVMPNTEKSLSFPRLDLKRDLTQIQDALADRSAMLDTTYFPNTNDVNGYVTKDLLHEGAIAGMHILHFSGHGYFTKEFGEKVGEVIGQGGVVLNDADGHESCVAGDSLAELLDRRGLRLVVLASCEGAKRDSVNTWSGVAPALIRKNIPAVASMQYNITDKSAIAFSHFLYTALASGVSIDEAMREARLAIASDIEWGIPVLYLRGEGDLVLFPRADHVQPITPLGPQVLIEADTKSSGDLKSNSNSPSLPRRLKGLPNNIRLSLRKALISIETDGSLATAFTTPELVGFASGLPQVGSVQNRVDTLIAYLLPKTYSGQPVLVFLLQVLKDNKEDDPDTQTQLQLLIDDLNTLTLSV